MTRNALGAEYWIERFALQAYTKGGYFRETYRAAEFIPPEGLPERFTGPHAFSTAIYFLLQGKQVSPLHRLKADEVWHFYAGGPLHLHLLYVDGMYSQIVLGPDADRGQVFQAVVPSGCWFGASLDELNTVESRPFDIQPYALVGCTVAPGFEVNDFELAGREQMLQLYPEHRAIILRLTEA